MAPPQRHRAEWHGVERHSGQRERIGDGHHGGHERDGGRPARRGGRDAVHGVRPWPDGPHRQRREGVHRRRARQRHRRREGGVRPSRQAWERIEPIAGLVEDIDVAVDARVDDFESEDDPAWTGWHKLEYLVYDVGDIGPESGATELADQLDADLATLQETMTSTDIPAAAIPVGASELIEEVSGGKLTGEEDRYSGTDLWDIAANVDGSHAAFETLEGAVEAKDPELVERIEAGFEDADELIEKYEDGDGYQSFDELTEEDSDAFKTTLGSLAEDLALVSGVLGLE
ncbi:MAG: EfeM/EfeO family lipoprotein [Ilumatobacteraceae bacterium]